MSIDISKAAAALGKKGGKSKSDRKAAASRENGKKGGRPMLRRYDNGDKNFDRVFINSLNGIDPETLTTREIKIQERWVNENWNDLNDPGN